VHRHFLTRESEVFRDLFAALGDHPKSFDEVPLIFLPDVTLREFEVLLDFFYEG
jgi:hypothetical protein